jgi:formylglycine-generating enzyme required for sulfatase activity
VIAMPFRPSIPELNKTGLQIRASMWFAMLQEQRVNRSNFRQTAALHPTNNVIVRLALLTALIGAAWLLRSRQQSGPMQAARPAAALLGFSPTIAASTPAPGQAPQGMAWIPGGEFSMGAQDPPDRDDVGMKATIDSRPIHRVYIDGFYMDKTDVTNAQFAKFVKAIGYLTIAERKPRAEDFPGAPPENLVAGSVVFSPPDHTVPLNDHFQWWNYIHGANWRHPPTSDITGKENFPVVHIAYEDAVAYANWADKRLPTEAEWEFAARGGLAGRPFVWGNEFRPQGKWMANTHQGHFPINDTGEDGYTGLAAVAQFPANGYGLYDMAGNVWQWTSDWYRPDYYRQLAATGDVARNPQGPSTSYDPSEPNQAKKVQRGGSFLCTDQYCSRYIVGTRGKGERDTGTNHLGFRCIVAPEQYTKHNTAADERIAGDGVARSPHSHLRKLHQRF